MHTTSFRSYAVVPAAGHSRRMGQHKLLLPWDERTVIECVLDAWQQSRVNRTVIVVRPGDEHLQDICRARDVDLIVPRTEPAEMKDSIQLALRFIDDTYKPTLDDAWLMAPADMPHLSTELINGLLVQFARCREIVVPKSGRRRGHPTVFAWSLAGQVAALADDQGVNVLLRENRVYEMAWDDDSIIQDLDVPDDYNRQRPQA